MNSPEPLSPSPSTPSSSSPPNEEINFTGGSSAGAAPADAKGFINSLTSHLSNFTGSSSSSSSKRRLPGGGSFAGSSQGSNPNRDRDLRTRRRDNSGRLGAAGEWAEGGGAAGKGGALGGAVGGKRDKDELLDTSLVEALRKEIGDPFLEPTA